MHRQRQAWCHGLEERSKSFQVIPRRWAIEPTFAWLLRARRLARDDDELLHEPGKATTRVAMSRLCPAGWQREQSTRGRCQLDGRRTK